MKEQLKNENEYREDGKLYVKEIRSCRCDKKEDDVYHLTCRIHQRGTDLYTFSVGQDWLSTAGPVNKRFYLAPDASAAVLAAISAFEATVADPEGSFERITAEDADVTLLLRPAGDKYRLIRKYRNSRTNSAVTELWHELTIEELLHEPGCDLYRPKRAEKVAPKHSAEQDLQRNPFYAYAVRHNDVELEKKIKVYYRIADREDCAVLEVLLGQRVLPPLPSAFDRAFAVESHTVTEEASSLLSRSGYVCLHRPYFAMHGNTHRAFTLNPHTKSWIDAAKAETPVISFEAYLRLFDGGDTKQ